MANKVISGHVGTTVSGISVTYTPTRGQSQGAVSDASGNHSSPSLAPGTYVISAQDPAGLLVFSSVSVTLDGTTDISNINLRSRAKNASNQAAGF